MGSAARTVNLPLHGGETYTPLCKLAQHFFSHSAAFTKFISKCRLFPYVSPNRARFLSRLRTAIPPWRPTVGRLFCWESPYCLPAIRALVALLPAAIRALGRPISLSLNTGSCFLPVCASASSASPLGRRERTSVRPLVLGLAS